MYMNRFMLWCAVLVCLGFASANTWSQSAGQTIKVPIANLNAAGSTGHVDITYSYIDSNGAKKEVKEENRPVDKTDSSVTIHPPEGAAADGTTVEIYDRINKDNFSTGKLVKDKKGNLGFKETADKAAKEESKKAESKGKSVFYDAPTSTLSFANDFIVGTGLLGDPLVEASVNLPIFKLLGTNPAKNELVFSLFDSDSSVTVQDPLKVFVDADTVFLTYSITDNFFYVTLFNIMFAGSDPTSPFFDPALPADVASAYLDNLRSVLDPSSPDFSATELYIEYHPDLNFLDATNGFTRSAESSITNFLFAANPVPVPEPAFIAIWGFFVLFWLEARRYRKRVRAISRLLKYSLSGEIRKISTS